MERVRLSPSSFIDRLPRNMRMILTISVICSAALIGFYGGILYSLSEETLENGLEWDSLVTEANYVIFADDEGMIQARNGFTAKIDYKSVNASQVINSVMESLPPTGGCVFVKAGTYVISETIEVPSNVTLMGAGFSSKLVLAASLNINIIENSHTRGNNNIMIANLHLDGNKAENPGQTGGLYFKRVRNSTIQNCWIHDSAFAGILIEKGGGNVIQNNFVYRNRNAGIEGTREDHDVVANNVIYSNEGDPYGYGIDYCTGSKHNVFEGNVCYNNGLTRGGGLSLWDGYQNNIVGNVLTSNYVGMAIGIPSFGNKTYGNMITANVVSNNTSNGLHIEGENNIVSKNTFSFNGGNGVYVNGSDTKNTIIEENHIENNQEWQIHVTPFPSDTVVRNNFISGGNSVEDQGVNTEIKWNSGYNTENAGEAAIPSGRTTTSFTHELVSTPTHVTLTPKDNLEGRSYWYTANSTHTTVHISSTDAENDHLFDWHAET